MKRLFSSLTLVALLVSNFSSVTLAQATPSELKDFQITAPTEVIINEAFDVKITALDAAGKKLEKYEGTIFFDTDSNPSDIVMPGEEGEYQFKLNDQGEHTFQKGFTLKKAGKYTITVFELDTADEIEKKFEITAVSKDAPPPVKSDITIKEPSSNTTVSTKTITVSGTSKPTSAINIKLNGVKVKSAQTDQSGNFSADIGELKPNDNVIIAEVLDGTGAVAGTSAPVAIKYSVNVPKLTSLTIKEGDEFFVGSSITFVGV